MFSTSEDFDVQVNRTLAVIGRSLDVCRAYLFLDSPDGLSTTNTHEWCADGVESQMADLQDMPYSIAPGWRQILEKNVVYAVEHIDEMPDDIRGVLEPLRIRAIIFAPLRVDGEVRGFLGFDECRGRRSWKAEEIESLKTISGIVTNAYSRKLLAERLASAADNFQRFFNTVDDIIVVGDLEGRLVWANEGTSRRLGYSLEELIGKPILEIHPPDKRDEAERILAAMFRREMAQCPLEVWTKDERRIPVETRVWFGEWDGEPCIFGTSKDLSAEQAALRKFERLFRGNPAPMAVTKAEDNTFVDVNEAFEQTFGHVRGDLVGRSSPDLGFVLDDERWRSASDELRRSGKLRDRRLMARRKDGSIVHGLFSGDIISSQGEDYFLTVMVDVTEQVELQRDLETEHSRLANVVEGTRLGTWEWNIQTGETVFNERWAEIIGRRLADLQPTSIETWVHFCHPDDFEESSRLLNLHFEGITDYYECECRMRHTDGSWIWVLDRGQVIERDEDGRPLMMYGTHVDITERRTLEEQIRELSIRDSLTGVYNRRHLFERLDEIVAEYDRRGRNFCLSLLDIDHFKELNDTCGHQAGDVVLKEFSRVIADMTRQYDLIGRYGGEEFVIISTSAGARETATMITRMMAAVRARSFLFNGRKMKLTFSCGVADSAEFERGSCSVEDMVALADKRLYAAKAAGRDRCFSK